MEYVVGALLLASFFGPAIYAVRRGNPMIGTLWMVLPLFGNTFAIYLDFIVACPDVTDISFVDAITKVYQSGFEVRGAACWSTSCSAHGSAAFCWKPASPTL